MIELFKQYKCVAFCSLYGITLTYLTGVSLRLAHPIRVAHIKWNIHALHALDRSSNQTVCEMPGLNHCSEMRSLMLNNKYCRSICAISFLYVTSRSFATHHLTSSQLSHFVSHVCLFLIHLFSKIISPHQCHHHHSYHPSPHHSSFVTDVVSLEYYHTVAATASPTGKLQMVLCS